MSPSILSGGLAALVAVGASLAIERFGGRLGGLLASVPSTIIPASLGFWWAATEPAHFEDALYAVPGGMLVNAVFLYAWQVLPARLQGRSGWGLVWKISLLSMLAWAVTAACLIALMELGLAPMFQMGIALFIVQLTLGISACWRVRPAPRGKNPVGPMTLVARGVLAGLAIAFSVGLAELGIPLLAGMASVFPAIFLTTMISVWISQGSAVQGGAVGPMILGSNSVSAYTLLAAVSIPSLGAGLGAAVAWLAAACFISVPSWFFLRWRSGEA